MQLIRAHLFPGAGEGLFRTGEQNEKGLFRIPDDPDNFWAGITPAHTRRPKCSFSSTKDAAAAYYFYWYQYPDHHFTDPDGSDGLTDHPPDAYLVPPPQYSYADANWHYRELLDLMNAGIEIILPVYWGDYTNTNWSQIGVTKLVEAENQMISEGKSPPKIGMFFDTTALKIQNGGSPPDLTTQAGKELFYKMIDDFFDRLPDHSLWARMNGKPIIYLYVSAYVSHYSQATFDYIKTEFTKNFPGETPYIVRESSWTGVMTDGVFNWGAALNGPSFSANLRLSVLATMTPRSTGATRPPFVIANAVNSTGMPGSRWWIAQPC